MVYVAARSGLVFIDLGSRAASHVRCIPRVGSKLFGNYGVASTG